jgi:D-glycero-D-manno-heptose 1,7-bisphosphate phosphatase
MQPVVVVAGGLGTRVRHLTGAELPKALLFLDGRPFIDFKLAGLAAAGVTDVVLLVGHGGSQLREHVGTGGAFGLRVTYLDEGDELLGTGGAIARALPELADPFWVTYGDTLLEVPMADVERTLANGDALGVMTTLENRDRWERSNVSVAEGLVTTYEKGAQPGTHRWIDYGMLLLRKAAFGDLAVGRQFDLGDVLRSLVAHRRLAAFAVSERFYDVGTEEAWRETDAWVHDTELWAHLERARFAGRTRRPAVFLDRDGVLNEVRLDKGMPLPPASAADLRIVEGAREALERLHNAGFALVVVTNQPDVPRGATTRESVEEINGALRARLPIDSVYTCYHDTGDGCDCRKPRPGLLWRAARDLGLDLSRSWLVGDRWVDVSAAKAAGVASVLVDRPYSWRASSEGAPPPDLHAAHRAQSVVEAADAILDHSRARGPGSTPS